MKKSFSLIEVIISISLLSVVIVALFQIKQNNLFYIDRFKQTVKYDEFISLATVLNSNNKLNNTNIYLDELVDFKDDDIRRKLKNIKINKKDISQKEITLNDEDFTININIIKSQYKLENKITKDIFTFTLGTQ